MTIFCERLREERKRLKLNQKEFCDISGVGQAVQSNYENGKRKPDSDYLTAIANAGVDISYLFTGIRTQSLGLEGYPDVSAEEVLGVALVVETLLRRDKANPSPQEKIAMFRLACEKSTPEERQAMVQAMNDGVFTLPVSIAKLFRFDTK